MSTTAASAASAATAAATASQPATAASAVTAATAPQPATRDSTAQFTTVLWIECEACGRWRALPHIADAAEVDTNGWTCARHPNPRQRRCASRSIAIKTAKVQSADPSEQPNDTTSATPLPPAQPAGSHAEITPPNSRPQRQRKPPLRYADVYEGGHAAVPATTATAREPPPPIFTLPSELLAHILSFLDLVSIIKASMTCRTLHQLVQNTPSLWRVAKLSRRCSENVLDRLFKAGTKIISVPLSMQHKSPQLGAFEQVELKATDGGPDDMVLACEALDFGPQPRVKALSLDNLRLNGSWRVKLPKTLEALYLRVWSGVERPFMLQVTLTSYYGFPRSLRVLVLDNINPSDFFDWEGLGNLPNLQALAIDACAAWGDYCIDLLKSSPHLKWLRLGLCIAWRREHHLYEGVPLPLLPALERLEIQGSVDVIMSAEFAQALAACRHLKHIYLSPMPSHVYEEQFNCLTETLRADQDLKIGSWAPALQAWWGCDSLLPYRPLQI